MSDGHHAEHHSQLVLFCQREKILCLLLPPGTAFWNVLRNRRAALAFVWVKLLLILGGRASAMLLCLTVIQIKQIVLDNPIKFFKSPQATSPKYALNLASAILEVRLWASTVALGEHTACSIP